MLNTVNISLLTSKMLIEAGEQGTIVKNEQNTFYSVIKKVDDWKEYYLVKNKSTEKEFSVQLFATIVRLIYNNE